MEGITQGIRSASVMEKRLKEHQNTEIQENKKVEAPKTVKEQLRHSRQRKGSGRTREGKKEEIKPPPKKSQ